MSTALPANMMSYIQNLVPGFGGVSPQQQPTYSDGNGFDVWTSGSSQGMPVNFSTALVDPASGYASQSSMPGGGFPGFVGFSPQVNFPFPIQQGPYQTAPMTQDGYNWSAAPSSNVTDYSQSFMSTGFPGFEGFSPQVNLPFPITQGPYQTSTVPSSPTITQDGYNWGAPQMPINTGYGQPPASGGGYPGFAGFSPQVNLPFPITQGPFQTSPVPTGSANASGGPQLMSHFYSDGNTTYWGETKPDGYYQFTPSGSNVNVMRTQGYEDPNPYNYAYHPYFSGWASDTPYSTTASQNPYYSG